MLPIAAVMSVNAVVAFVTEVRLSDDRFVAVVALKPMLEAASLPTVASIELLPSRFHQ